MGFQEFLTSDILYNLAGGPLARISFAVFLIGTVVRTIRFMSLTRVVKRDRTVSSGITQRKRALKRFFKQLPQYLSSLRYTILAKSPVTISVSVIFHVCLLMTPLFLLAHNIMLANFLGIGFFSLPEQTTHVMTIMFLVCAAYFLLRRMVVARVRMISSVYDYLILGVTTLPFITGLMAYYQVYDYKMMIILHMLSGELMLITAPFTKIFHMVFFFVGRFVLIGQHTLGRGSREWQWE